MSDDMEKKLLAQRLTTKREDMGLSQQELAEAVGLSIRSVYTYENAISVPRVDNFKAIAYTFGVSSSLLLGDLRVPLRDSDLSVEEFLERFQNADELKKRFIINFAEYIMSANVVVVVDEEVTDKVKRVKNRPKTLLVREIT